MRSLKLDSRDQLHPQLSQQLDICWIVEKWNVPAPYLVLSLNLSSLMLSILFSPPGKKNCFELVYLFYKLSQIQKILTKPETGSRSESTKSASVTSIYIGLNI